MDPEIFTILVTLVTTTITWIILQKMSQPTNKVPSNDHQPMERDDDDETEFAHLQIARAAFAEDLSIPRTACK